jgi:hypothetical protein
MAKWECSGCPTKCKIEEPLSLSVPETIPTLSATWPITDKPKVELATPPDPLEYPFATICPSAGRTD